MRVVAKFERGVNILAIDLNFVILRAGEPIGGRYEKLFFGLDGRFWGRSGSEGAGDFIEVTVKEGVGLRGRGVVGVLRGDFLELFFVDDVGDLVGADGGACAVVGDGVHGKGVLFWKFSFDGEDGAIQIFLKVLAVLEGEREGLRVDAGGGEPPVRRGELSVCVGGDGKEEETQRERGHAMVCGLHK